MRPGRASVRQWPGWYPRGAQHVATEAALQQARSERSRAEDAIGQIEGINAR